MIYLIHGADSFRSHEKLNELIAEFGRKDKGQINLEVFDADPPVGRLGITKYYFVIHSN